LIKLDNNWHFSCKINLYWLFDLYLYYIDVSNHVFLVFRLPMKFSIKRIIIIFLVSISVLFSAVTVARSFSSDADESTQTNLLQQLRIQALQILIDSGFNRFMTMPFGPGSDFVHLTWSQVYPDYPDYYVTTGINVQDDLDILLLKKIEELYANRSRFGKFSKPSFDEIVRNDEDIQLLKTVYLFKKPQDLKDLWYVVSSYRTRINNDADWRKDNIFISYRNIGNVRVINPQQQLSFMDEIHYDAAIKNWKKDTVSWLAIMWGVSSVKGGGICGASRGINAAIITNKAFDIITRYNHTKTWKYMYQNDINGKEYWIPGLDVAVYRMWGSQKDFVFKNIREYPVVLVMNYDGTKWWQEELFVLSKEQDRGELKYIWSKGNCYSREVNGEVFRSCYNLVSWW